MGESLKDVVRRAHGQARTKDLPDTAEEKVHPPFVLPRHDAWMALPEDQQLWSPEAIQFAYDVLAGKYKHDRAGRVSPSAVGDGCERLLLFAFAQAPQSPFPKANKEKMSAGEFHHLRWQMEGLTAGYMNAGELWIHSEALRCGGSADARLIDGSLFELKSTAGHLFKCAREMLKPPEERNTKRYTAWDYFQGLHNKHLKQIETYHLVDEVGASERGEQRLLSDWASLVYQNAGEPGEMVEFRLHTSPERRREIHRVLESLHDWIDIDDLPDMLEGCRRIVDGESATEKELTLYSRCQYRDHCPTATGLTVG
jgi:hypothetical protein